MDVNEHAQHQLQHLVAQRVLLGWMRDAQQPEDRDTDRRDRGGHRVEPEQVSAVDREARYHDHGCDGRHEHRGGDDGVSGHHGSDFTVPHDDENPSLQPMAKKTPGFETDSLLMLIWRRLSPAD